jgi:hypothetical protein
LIQKLACHGHANGKISEAVVVRFGVRQGLAVVLSFTLVLFLLVFFSWAFFFLILFSLLSI